MNNFFKALHFSNKSKARLGEIKTAHGTIKTPAFVAVGTKGTVKALTPELVKKVGTQTAFVNTYHLVTHPGVEVIEKAGGIHKYSGLNIPLMSDSGGFQVFSLAKNDKARRRVFSSTSPPTKLGGPPSHRLQKQASSLSRIADIRGEEQPLLVKISEDGVKFRSTFDGKLIEFTPEKSMEYQGKIGADINMAFDECTYYPATHEYAEKAMKRTHEWLIRCIKKITSLRVNEFKNKNSLNSLNSPNSIINNQYLYGVIQGATFEDLRKKSAEFVVSQDIPGVAIGGVSVGESKKEMREQVRWVADYLPKDRPVHLLGVGQIDDIIDLVKYGIDTFDCVEPTRLARMGTLYQVRQRKFFDAVGTPTPQKRKKFVALPENEIDITRSVYKNNLEKVDEDCDCYVCKSFTKSYLHHLFKQREILGYTLATYHNLWTMEKFFEKIRELIAKDII